MSDRFAVVSTDETTGQSRYVRGVDGEPFQGTLEECRRFVARWGGDMSDEPRTFAVFAVAVGGAAQIELARGTRA